VAACNPLVLISVGFRKDKGFVSSPCRVVFLRDSLLHCDLVPHDESDEPNNRG